MVLVRFGFSGHLPEAKLPDIILFWLIVFVCGDNYTRRVYTYNISFADCSVPRIQFWIASDFEWAHGAMQNLRLRARVRVYTRLYHDHGDNNDYVYDLLCMSSDHSVNDEVKGKWTFFRTKTASNTNADTVICRSTFSFL